ncbi:MAG: dihydroorotate dehydrogenase electron transfer subunit [Chloroflexi bacterium]|nr:dihydroorotate dehydrogenase electron transfer subunit [Chloroflexota bacterium]
MNEVFSKIITNQKLMNDPEGKRDVFLLGIEAPGIATSAKPGQFLMVRCSDDSYPLLRRPFSIHRVKGNQVFILYIVLGIGTSWLSRRKQNDFINVIGPLGNGFSIESKSKNVLLIAGGIGVAPIVALAEYSLNKGYSTRLIMGARRASLLYPEASLPSGLITEIVTEDGSKGKKGLVTDFLAEASDVSQIFACGPLSMYKTINSRKEILRAIPAQVSMEQVLGCGYGVCYGCTIETVKGLKQVCHDGPVFNLADILWDKVVDPRLERAY